MSYNVQAASGEYIGWKLLERTMPRQRAAFMNNSSMHASKKHFQKEILKITSAEEFVRDRKLMTVALRAFGLDEDINNIYFIKKVLDADPNDKGSLVNKLADKRYLKLNQALSLSSATSKNLSANLANILEKFDDRSFEKNIGERHSEIELALNAKRELLSISKADISENAKWYQILGSKPLRKVFEGAFGLDGNFTSLPLERQLSDFKNRNQKLIGSSDPSQFNSPDVIEKLIRTFLLRSKHGSAVFVSPYALSLSILTSGHATKV